MAILCDKRTKLLVQGVGRMGQFHANLSREYGTQVVGGVAPGKGGQSSGGSGSILNTASTTLMRTELRRFSPIHPAAGGGKRSGRCSSNADAVARTKFVAGPAAATQIMSRRGLLRREKLTGTGLA